MNILFLTLAWPEDNEQNIYTDLMEEFRSAKHSVYVVTARERRIGKPTFCSVENNMHILRVKSGNIQKTNPLEKGISSILLGYQMEASINKYFSNITFDLIICSTPPITLTRVIKSVKKKHNAKVYLLLKDIWPQGPADMGAIKEGGFVWHFFKQKEKQIYEVSDYIGCMSSANVNYILEHNKNMNPNKVEECPNSIIPRKRKEIDIYGTRIKYGIPVEATVFMFGGNLGKPQGVSFLVDTATKLVDRKEIFFVIVGSGVEYSRIKEKIEKNDCNNVLLIKRLPKNDYEDLARACDIGLILLDKRFTIPNFPSRLLSYLDLGMPILCATDKVTDVGQIVEEWKCGMKIEHGDSDSFISAIERLSHDKDLRLQMADHAVKLLKEKYTAKRSYDIIISHFKGENLYVQK